MTKPSLVVFTALVFLAAIALNTYVGLHDDSSLHGTQHQLLVSEKASTQTRVVTVQQRCDLTADVRSLVEQIAHDNLVRHGPAAAAPFMARLATLTVSYTGCETQLAMVRKINAHTPAP